MPKKYELRQLNAADIFPMSRILGKIGINEFKNALDPAALQQIINREEGKEGLQESVGMQVFLDIANVLLSNLGNVEKEIFQFLSNVSGLPVADVRKHSMAEFVEMIIDLVKKEESR